MKQIKVKEYLQPGTLQEVIATYRDHPSGIMVIAGGTDIFAAEHPDVEALLDISNAGLSYIREENGCIIIGAAATFAEIIKSELIENKLTALYEAARHLADKTIRNMATIGGNVCTALPSGDSISPLVASDAVFIVATPEGDKKFSCSEFFLGPRKSVLQKGWVLREIRVPALNKGSASTFEKMGRNSEDLAIVNVAARLSVNIAGEVIEAKIAHGAVGPVCLRSPRLEASLIGKKLCDESLKKYCKVVADEIRPIDNIRATAEYRREISCVLTRRALLRAYVRAGKEMAE